MLINFIAPYHVPWFRALGRRVRELRVFISTSMERNRQWSAEWGDLPVTVQRSVTLPRTWRHPHGFAEKTYVHIPYNTLPLLWRYRPDVVIAGELGARTLQARIYARWRKTALIIWTTMSEESERGRGRFRRFLRSRLLKGADIVLVNGASGARYIESYGFPVSRMVTVPYTTEVGAFATTPIEKSAATTARLVYVGSLSERKGVVPFVGVLVAWAESHPAQPIELLIAGQGPLEKEIQPARLPDNFRLTMLGTVSYENLPEIYSSAGALVFPTLADEWGLVVNEAMAAGLPVLGSIYSQAVQELVEEGRTGWTFRPDVAGDVERVLDQYFATSADDLTEMGRAARSRSLALDPDMVAGRMAEAIERAASPHP